MRKWTTGLCKKKTAKIIVMIVGICCITGSLCACNNDSGVTKQTGQIVADIPAVQDVPEQIATDISEEEDASEEMQQEMQQEVPEDPSEEAGITRITVSAAGDVTLGNYPEQGYQYSLHETYDTVGGAGYFFENVYDIFGTDDMTIVNLEGVLTDAENKLEGRTYCLKGRPEYVKILTDGSVEAVGMANNHRLDYLEQGSADTVSVLEDAGIVYAFDENTGIYETQGIKIGLIAVNEVEMGAWLAEQQIRSGISKLQDEGADLILISCHWGAERENVPEEAQQILGRKCIDLGADLVIGHHPHVLQAVEEYQGKYIVYSLGNFCFGANRNPPDKDTVIFQQTFTFIEGEKQADKDIRMIPCSVSSITERNDFRPTPAEGQEAERILNRMNELSRDFGVQFDAEGRPIVTDQNEGEI